MIVYHFCCERDMRGIRNQGITKGAIPGEKKVPQGKGKPGKWVTMLIMGWQWLTFDPDRAKQSWNTRHLLRYDRTEYRWTIDIPENMKGQLYDRDRLEKLYPGSKALFDGWKGSENWVAFRGPIPKKWLIKLEHWNKKTESWEEA